MRGWLISIPSPGPPGCTVCLFTYCPNSPSDFPGAQFQLTSANQGLKLLVSSQALFTFFQLIIG